MTEVTKENNESVDDEVSIRDLMSNIKNFYYFLLSKWKLIFVSGVIGAMIGLGLSLISKPVFKAELNFALEDEKSGGLSGAMGLASQFGIDLGGGAGGGAFAGDNLLELMKSRSMVENTLLTTINIKGKPQTLAELYITFNGLRKQWGDEPELNGINFLPNADRSKFTLKQDSLLGVFYKQLIKGNLSVDKVDKKLSIITVKVESQHELFSKYFTEVLVKNVSDFYINTKTKKSVQNVLILQHQTDSIRRELNSALSGVASSFDANPNANPALQILRVPSQRRQVDVQADQAILTQLVANLEVSKVSLRKETPLIQIIDKPILPLEKSKFSKIKGIVLGGFISVFLIVGFLFFKKLFSNLA